MWMRTAHGWGWATALGAAFAAGCGGTSALPDATIPAASGDPSRPAAPLVPEATRGVVQLTAGLEHTCALLAGGRVRCWGTNRRGQLGYPGVAEVGRQRAPASAGDVNVGGVVRQLVAGRDHTCALLVGGAVRCWGANYSDQLGRGQASDGVDPRSPAEMGDVSLGGQATQIAAGGGHTCALLKGGTVRCWGANNQGQLGYGTTDAITPKRLPSVAGDVRVGGKVVQIVAGQQHTCAALDSGRVRCWGDNTVGQLGYRGVSSVGDQQAPVDAGDVGVGAEVNQLTAGGDQTCALLAGGAVRCWGEVHAPGSSPPIGEATTLEMVDVSVGGPVAQVASGGEYTCALLARGQVRCWGSYGPHRFLVTNDTPTQALVDVELGGA
ncbi:MAG: hypothetical protein EOO75_15805, partial [Myxococcales bacterium]